MMDPRICPKRLCEIVTGQSTNGCCCSVFSMKVDLNVITFCSRFFSKLPRQAAVPEQCSKLELWAKEVTLVPADDSAN